VTLLNSKDKAFLFVHAAIEKKAKNVVILDMRQILDFADYFVICNGATSVQLEAVSKKIMEDLSKAKEYIWHKEGLYDSGWILMDYGDVVGHIFLPDKRKFYDLESLWADAPIIKINEDETHEVRRL